MDQPMCVVCGGPIPAARAELIGSRVRTCSLACADAHRKALWRRNSQRRRDQAKGART